MKGTVTPDLASSYAVEGYAVLEQLQLRREAFSGAQLRGRFPQFDADGGWLDVDAGFADLAAVTQALARGWTPAAFGWWRTPNLRGGSNLRGNGSSPRITALSNPRPWW